MSREPRPRYDVVIVGAGLAGLTLARHLLLQTTKSILLIDRRENPPQDAPQKYGESLVQCSGHYLSKVLDLEDHLLLEHYLKYNLRFHWTTDGLDNTGYEDYSQSYIRKQSNIATFQLDRNRLEAHLLKTNTGSTRCDFIGGTRDVRVELGGGGDDHRIAWGGAETRCRWVVDASGRGRLIRRQFGLEMENPIRHGAIFFWVDGLVNIERLSGRSREELLYGRWRRRLGHFPLFLGTNHFCAEGQWFWVIPLHHKTSLGLVYDHRSVEPDEVSTPAKTIEYVCRKWPLFARDLPNRRILDQGRLVDFSYDCKQTISAERWALVGEAGRFSDPLYSPGSDLIGIYNTLIVDAVQTDDAGALAEKCQMAEAIQRVMYESYVPSYASSYDCLGDQEAFTLKYTWELTVYFGFFVLPMINGLFANLPFMRSFLQRFAILGPINHNLQRTLSAFFQWKKGQPRRNWSEPRLFELYDMQPLLEAETLFYETGLGTAEALEVVDRHVERLREFARYILAHIHASVTGDLEVLTNASFISSLTLRDTVFDPEAMKAAVARHQGSRQTYRWNLNPMALGGHVVTREPVSDATHHTRGAT